MASMGKHTENLLHAELERRILHGLACEWETALWVLDPAHRESMRKPLFSLKNMTQRLAYWSRDKREICLSRDLVLNHPWDAVQEVLIHEIAHQFAEEALGAHDESPHGATFLGACHLLRANPKASANYKPLDERIRSEMWNPKDKILLRVKKLMALATSHNVHEAESAMAKAHELIAKYNLNLMAREEKRDYVSVFLGKPALRRFREDYRLARLLQDFYFVYGIWTTAFVLEKNKLGRVLEITGTLQNVRLAAYVHDYVRHFIDSQWSTYNEDKGLNRYRKTDYAVGIIEGFTSKLKAQSKRKTKVHQEAALIKLEDPLLTAYASYRYPNTVSVTKTTSNQDDRVFRHGIGVGKKLVIAKGIASNIETPTKLLKDSTDTV
jgi:hypothetical protein